MTNEFEAPINASDVITFHIEFSTTVDDDDGQTGPLYRDAFECSMQKQSTTDYWDVTTTDFYVRDDGTNTYNSDPVEDYNNSIPNDGQDWFVYETDANRETNLCTASSTFQCDKIRCIARREMTNDDPDDMDFLPTTALA